MRYLAVGDVHGCFKALTTLESKTILALSIVSEDNTGVSLEEPLGSLPRSDSREVGCLYRSTGEGNERFCWPNRCDL